VIVRSSQRNNGSGSNAIGKKRNSAFGIGVQWLLPARGRPLLLMRLWLRRAVTRKVSLRTKTTSLVVLCSAESVVGAADTSKRRKINNSDFQSYVANTQFVPPPTQGRPTLSVEKKSTRCPKCLQSFHSRQALDAHHFKHSEFLVRAWNMHTDCDICVGSIVTISSRWRAQHTSAEAKIRQGLPS
jgi:hypothetical protein